MILWYHGRTGRCLLVHKEVQKEAPTILLTRNPKNAKKQNNRKQKLAQIEARLPVSLPVKQPQKWVPSKERTSHDYNMMLGKLPPPMSTSIEWI